MTNASKCGLGFVIEEVMDTDNSKDKKGNVNVYAGILKKCGEKVQLNPIEDEKMFDRIEIILNELQKEVRKNTRIE